MKSKEFWEKAKTTLIRILPEIAIILGGLILDLVSKAIVAANMELGQTVTIIPKFLNFSYTVNTRAAFGSDFGLDKIFGGRGTMIFFIVLTVVAVGFFGFLLFKNHKKGILYRISFSLIIAGALGNLYDRIFLSGVRDFIQIEYFGLELFGSKTFAIFNIADSCVVVGTVLLLVFIIFFDKTFKEPIKDEGVDLPQTDQNNNDVDNNESNEIANTSEITTETSEEIDNK